MRALAAPRASRALIRRLPCAPSLRRSNYINVVSVHVDCDGDSLIYMGVPDGPACHTVRLAGTLQCRACGVRAAPPGSRRADAMHAGSPTWSSLTER